MILVNALGVIDSGGIVVLDKFLCECLEYPLGRRYLIIANDNFNIRQLLGKYKENSLFDLLIIKNKGFMYRLFYENLIFRKLVKEHCIDLIYNFSGTTQFFTKTPQLIKIQNLLFYSKKLDGSYQEKKLFLRWLKDIFVKRMIFIQMLSFATHFEIQSSHVKRCLSDFINTRNKFFYVKSDVDVSDIEFHTPRQYDFAKKIKFLYIVGPHFESLHKNFQDFTNAMMSLAEAGIGFEINITLSNEQLSSSKVWDASLDSKTNFLGYISDQEKIMELFCDNTILISTSVIETLGLHVIEGIKHGVITIVPDEEYANTVYGSNLFKYKLFNTNALFSTVMTIINGNGPYSDKILSAQDDLRQSEMSKLYSIQDVFDEVINVQG
jgi:glycosyltransferase involved in cell wall biosynthesis